MNPRRRIIARMGQTLGPRVLAAVQDLYRDEQEAFVGMPPSLVDAVYGEHPRQRLDVYEPESGGTCAPMLLWVHGGGFVRGEKSAGDHPFNAHVGRWAARQGMVGAVMNYRLAPDHGWPAGGEDVGMAVDWLHANALVHGGDPTRIVVAGTSAGAVHVATHLGLRAERPSVAGAVLLSGLYGLTPLDDRDVLYFGQPDLFADRAPLEGVVETEVPLLVACAEFDPPRFQAETSGLLAARLQRHGRLPQALVAAGHNHFSLPCHVGTVDRALTDAIFGFIADLPPSKDKE